MDEQQAVKAMGALAHQNRMSLFRLLIVEGADGLCAGDIATRLGVSPSALSFHLSHLESAGLIYSWRDGRNLFYAAQTGGIRDLLGFLMKDCCNGRPGLCGPFELAPSNCSSSGKNDHGNR